MKASWQIMRLGSLCAVKNGKSDTQDAVEGGDFVFFDRSKTVKRSNRFLFDCEALIIPGEGKEFLPRHFIGKFDLHQRAYALQSFNDCIDIKFLYYYLNHRSDYLPSVAVGATVKSLRMRHFEEFPVSVTSLPEQQRIVSILDEAFAGIATARAHAEKNLQNARALFESHLQSVFSQRDEGWMERRLGDVAVFRNGINFTKSSKGESIKILGVKDFQENYWAPLDGLDAIIPEGDLSDADILMPNDLVFVRSNGNPELIGRCVLVGDVSERITHSGFTIRARLRTEEVRPAYLCHFLKSTRVRREMIEGGNGANIKSLNQGTLSNLVIPFPSVIDEQIQLVGHLEALQEETQRLASLYQRKIAALDELKKSLLHQAFSGQL